MKKYFILGAAVVIFGLLINYTLGGFTPVQAEKVEVSDYVIYGIAFEGSYKSNGLSELVEKMRQLQQDFNGAADVVIVNYYNEDKEKIGLVNNFVGIRFHSAEPDSLAGLEKRVIKAQHALRSEVKIRPLVMPSPEKIKKKAFDLAEQKGIELQKFSIEQYNDSGVLQVEFPVKEQTFQEKLANAYGIDSFEKIEKLEYTFNVKKGEVEVARAWIWEPKTDEVTLVEKGDTIRFNHNSVTEELKTADHKFINDKYWLLFPFQLMWDTGYTSELKEDVEAPISKQKLTKFIIHYNNKDGYTPGDAYDFYIDQNFQIKEWSFRKGGKEDPSLTTTWEDYETINGIKVATNHLSVDGSFRLWFTEIEFR